MSLITSPGADPLGNRYEMLAEPQRDITPEQAAARLRSCGGKLYRNKEL